MKTKQPFFGNHWAKLFIVGGALGLALPSGLAQKLSLPPTAPQEISRFTLASPGSLTNLFCRRREISPDQTALWQERYWLENGNVHVLQEDVPNTNGFLSLSQVPEETWSQAKMLFELIKSKEGTRERHRANPELEALIAGKVADFYSEHPDGRVIISGRPDEWRPGGEKFLSVYGLTVETSLVQRLTIEGTRVESNRVTMPIGVRRDGSPLIWECVFSPDTHVKVLERVLANGLVIREQVWKTNAAMDSSQFAVHCEPVEDVKLDPLSGIGVTLAGAKTGPFRIMTLIQNAPAAEAGLRVGDLILAIDGKPTDQMQLQDAVALVRGKPDSKVELDVRTAASGERKHISLQRKILLLPVL